MRKKQNDKSYHLILITASGKCKRPTHILHRDTQRAEKNETKNRECVRAASTNTESISAKTRLIGYITSFIVRAVSTFAEVEGVIRLDEMK